MLKVFCKGRCEYQLVSKHIHVKNRIHITHQRYLCRIHNEPKKGDNVCYQLRRADGQRNTFFRKLVIDD